MARRRSSPAPPAGSTAATIGAARFLRPATVTELCERYAAGPEAMLVAGATDVGVEINLRHARNPLLLAIDHLPELRTLTTTPEHIEIGAALTLSELERDLDGAVPLLSEMFPLFASPLIRNTATLGGNIATASPIGDAAPVLLALNASLVLASVGGERTVALADYFTGYRETVRARGEVIRAIRIPRPQPGVSAFYKVSKRRFDDISSVAVAIAITLGSAPPGHETPDDAAPPGHETPDDDASLDDDAPPDGVHVTDVRIGLGGVAATPIRARATEEALTGMPWTADTFAASAAILATEGTPMDDHRASAAYRAAMLEQSMLRFVADTRPGPPAAAQVTR